MEKLTPRVKMFLQIEKNDKSTIKKEQSLNSKSAIQAVKDKRPAKVSYL